jgi:hypothetical protein
VLDGHCTLGRFAEGLSFAMNGTGG